MFLKSIFFIIMPILCESEITINVTVASNRGNIILKTTGHDDKLVTEREINLFNLTMPNLNKGLRKELGKVPDGGVYLKDPTPHGDLFKKFKWRQVHRRVEVEKVEVVDIANIREILRKQEHINNATETAEHHREVSDVIESTASSIWSKYGLEDENIYYNVNIKIRNGTLRYQNKWRDGSTKSSMIKIEAREKGISHIKPGDSVYTNLTAFKTVILVKVQFKASMVGNLIADYDDLYGKYHYYAPTIGNIMRAGKLNNYIKTSELIEIRCHTDPKLEVFDSAGRTVKPEVPMWIQKLRRDWQKIKKPS